MIDQRDPITRDQDDFTGRLSADSYFADITVLEQRKGVTESDIQTALGVLNEKVGKIGACSIVLMPDLQPSEADAPGPEYRVRGTVQVITNALFNDGETGTGKPAEAITLRVRQLIHRFQGGTGCWSFAGMEPVERGPGEVSYLVHFTRKGVDAAYTKVATPLFTPSEGVIPLSLSLTAAGADSIYYTLDGSYPWSGNPEAVLYAGAFDLVTPGVVRAVAYKALYQPSNVARAVARTNSDFSDEFTEEFN